MRRTLLTFFLAALLAAAWASTAAAGTLTGMVRNGTTGRPASGVNVILIQLQGEMEAVANGKTDSQGRYRMEHSAVGQRPMLVRANYRGVNFNQSLPPGRDVADIEVFDLTADPGALQIATRMIVFQPNGSALLVGEEYSVQNHSKPPAAQYSKNGNFEFQVPEGGELAQVTAWGPAGMPVTQGTMDRGNRKYAIAFAFRPGQNGVRLSYQVPYTSNAAVVRATSPYAVGRVLVVAPPTMQVASPGLVPAGTEQGWNVYARDAVPANAPFDLTVSGTAPPPSAGTQEGQTGSSGRDASSSQGSVHVLASRLDSLKWALLGGFAVLFVLGMVFLWRKPVESPVQQGAAPAIPVEERSAKSKSRETTHIAQAQSQLDQVVNQSLEELKDTLLRLELRRQAGTLSEQEYARERKCAEQRLRELVKG